MTVRPSLTPHVEALVAALTADVDELHGLATSSVVVVALSAHATAAASVRSLAGCAKSVVVDGHRRKVELALRPPFFLDGDATRRLATLVHELLHIDPRSPGRLLEERRHVVRPHGAHERHAAGLAKRWLAHGDVSLLLPLAHEGEATLRAWKHRPVEETKARAFTDRDVFEQPLIVRTAKGLRSVWW